MDWSLFPKPFRGYPQTLILKALRGCHFPMVREPIADDHGNTIDAGMPPEIQTLQKATRSKRKRNTDDGDNERSGDDDNGEKKGPGSRDGSEGKKPLAKSQRFSSRLQKQQLGSKTKYTQPCPPEAASAKGVLDWLDHVEDPGSLQATTPISPPESENLKQEERKVIEQQLEEHNEGESAAASSHHADQNANATCHWMFGPQKTAADVISDTGSWQKIRDREFAALIAREAALEKERRNQRYAYGGLNRA
ncbi:hypothetical protein EMCG_01783 [[Emmonsia] crescens]|uniref:Uncharacterized protein n=1 Tax=[Emmonsia] crescens TaxID=73230 RepID=A0A0G2J2A3_9EURO|nr:hypothetical protein EMCG_01783 [Emmonsia crescens UAMH 3008]